MRRECTLKEIAKIAGVSPTTVQNVLNGKSGAMREITYRRVSAVIEEMGYIEKVAPKLLNGKSRKIIGIVMSDQMIESEELIDAATAMCLLEAEYQKKKFYTLLHVSSRLDEIASFFMAWPTDCLYVCGFGEDEIWYLNEKTELPVHNLL